MAGISIQPYFGRGGLAVPRLPRTSAGDTLAGALAPAVAQIERTAAVLADEDATREADNLLLKARTDFTAWQDTLKGRDDYGKFAPDWQTYFDQWKSQNLSGANRLVRDKLGTRIDQLGLVAGEDVRGTAWATQLDVSRAGLSRFLDTSFQLIGKDPTGNLARDTLAGIGERIDNAEEAGFLTAQQAEAMRQETKGRYGVLGATSLIDKNPYDAKRQLEAGAFDSYMDPEKKLQLIGAADREIDRREAAARREVEKQQQLAAMDLEIKVSRGQAGEAEIYDALGKGIVSPSAAADLVKSADATKEKAKKEADQRRRVNDALTGTGPALSPGNADDRKAVDLAYDDFSAALDGRDPDEAASLAVNWVAGAGILPSQLDDFMRSGARGAPDAVLSAADMLGRLQDAAPLLAQSLDGSDYTFLRMVQHYVETGVAGPRAVDLARADVTEAKAPEREERKAKWSADSGKLEKTARQWLSSQLDDSGFLFGSASTLPDGLVGEFTEKARSYYIATGDANAAQTMALRDIKATWGKTSIGGDHWMQYPPEMVYGDGSAADSEWMQRQLYEDVSANLLKHGGAGGNLSADPSQYRLVPAPTASRQELPSYFVTFTRDDGVIEMVTDGKGRPLLWRPDWATSGEPEKNKAAVDKAEADARERRNQVEQMQNLPPGPLDGFLPEAR